MGAGRLTRDFVLLRALRWLPVGIVLPFLTITQVARGLSLAEVGGVFAVHSAVAIALEIPSGALSDTLGRRRVTLAGAALTAASLVLFGVAESVPAFTLAVGALAAGRALISGALEAWYVDSLRALDPEAPLSPGLTRGTAAEAIALGLGSLLGGLIVSLSAGPDPGAGLSSGYGLAALAAALAALVYLVAVLVLVREPEPSARLGPGDLAAVRLREVFATARSEAMASIVVRSLLLVAVAWGLTISAVELLWQPRFADLGDGQPEGLALGALGAGSMLAVAAGAALGPLVRRRAGIVAAYLGGLVATGVLVVCLGLAGAPLPFAMVYLVVYMSGGISEPFHDELLNEAVGSRARATLNSAGALAVQSGSLVANASLGAVAAAASVGLAWAFAGAALVLACALVAAPLRRAAQPALERPVA